MSQPLFDPIQPLITDRHNVVMAAGTDVETVEEPASHGDVKSHSAPSQNTHTSMSHYLGLPYQDHNYGQPPPPTPPQSPPPTLDTIPVIPTLSTVYEAANSNITPPEDNADSAKDEGVTRCICNMDHDDGYMICCDKCLVWQHVECMGLDRHNIPDVYYCDKCQPRPVDAQRAIALQTIKRKQIIERLARNEEDSKRKSKSKTRYSSVSNTPTSLTLMSTKARNKMKKKKKKKEKEREREKEREKLKQLEREEEKEKEKDKKQEGKHHKKKKKKKRKHRRHRSRTEPGIGDLLLHGEQVFENADHFVEATENQYSTELNQFLTAQRQNPLWTMPSLGCIMDDLSPQKIRLGQTGRTARGLVATEELSPNQPIVEYRGMLMLRDQFVPTNGWTKKPYLHVLVYKKFSNIELCVDARKYGNIARYVRKSCSPNAEVRHVAIDGLLRLYLFSLVEITKGTEVTVGFDFSYKDCSHPVKCACAKKNCPVKRYWRKRRALEARNQRKPSSDGPAATPMKRTVSPLRVSLTAANGAENRVEPVIRNDDPPKLVKEETTTASSNQSHHSSRRKENVEKDPTPTVVTPVDTDQKEKVDVVAVDTTTQSSEPLINEKENTASSTPKEEQAPPRKMTREERKMEAIMKAFAKMEKAQERRQQALDRIAQSKGQGGGQVPDEKPPTTPSQVSQPKQQQKQGPSQQKQMLQQKQSSPPKPASQETPALQQQQLPSQPQESLSTAGQPGDQVSLSDSGKEEQPKATEPITKEQPSSNTATPVTRKQSRRRRRSSMSNRRRSRANSLASTATSIEASSADDDSNQAPPVPKETEKASHPQTPLFISTSSSGVDKSDPAPTSPSASTSKRFRFHTKKFLMNEWLTEQAFEQLAGKPLTIKTELDTSYSSSLASPNTPLLQRSGSLSALVKDSRGNGLDSSSGLGSAKKRWLRQAMSEGSSNPDQIACNGTLSPIASPALSPNTSASSDMMTPLKKRMLRHSLVEDGGAQGGSSPRHEQKPQDALMAPPPSIPENQLYDEPPVLIQAKTELETVQEEDVRKNSSIDSGLSVTTPADLEKSPIALKAGLEDRLRDFSGEERTVKEEEQETPMECEAAVVTGSSKASSDNNNVTKEDSVKCMDETKDDQKSKSEILRTTESDSVNVTKENLSKESEGRTITPQTDKEQESEHSVDIAAKDPSVQAATQDDSVALLKSSETTSSAVVEQSSKDAHLTNSEDLKSRSLTDVMKSAHLSLCEANPRARHMSGPGAMQGYRDESGPLTLNSSFADDNAISSSSLYTPFSPKKRLLRQNTDPNDAKPSMASSWPQNLFGPSQALARPKDECDGPRQPGETPLDPGAPIIQPSPGKLSASWSPGVWSVPSAAGTSPRTLDPGVTPSPSPSPGPQIPPPPTVQGIHKAGNSPLSAVRNLGNSLSAIDGAVGDPQEQATSQNTVTSAAPPTSASEDSTPNSSAQSTPVKKKVSLTEYRKRRSTSTKPASSSTTSSSTTTTTTTSSTSITAALASATSSGSSTKLPLITLPNIPLPDVPPVDPLKDEKKPSKTPSKSTSSPPTSNPTLKPPAPPPQGVASPRKGDSGSTSKPGSKPSTPPKSGFAIFSTKTSDGQKPTLTLTNEAQQVINSITSLLMEESIASNGDIKDRTIRRSDSAPGDSRFVRRNFQDKPWEKDGRGDATGGSLKRPLSPEPPPPPPGKRLCTGPVPPPPPPKGVAAVPRDSRPGENGPAMPVRQNSAPGGAAMGPMATNSPLKNVSGNAVVPAQYGIAHRNQNQQYPMQYGPQQQPPPPQPQQQQFAANTYHQHPSQPQSQQAPQQQPVTRPPPQPVPPPQKPSNFNYQYSNQTTENANTQGFASQHTGYPTMPYRQSQNQHGNHYGVQNKFPSNGRKSPYGSQDSNRQHAYYGRGNANTYTAKKNFHSQ